MSHSWRSRAGSKLVAAHAETTDRKARGLDSLEGHRRWAVILWNSPRGVGGVGLCVQLIVTRFDPGAT